MTTKIIAIFKSIHVNIWLGIITFLLIITVFPVAAKNLPSIEPQVQTTGNLLEQGVTLDENGQFAEAIKIWQQAEQNYQQQGDYLNQALSLSYLSLAYQELGQWVQAQKAIASSLDLLKKTSHLDTQGIAILARVLNSQGNFELAIGHGEEALNIWQEAEQNYQKAGDKLGVLGSQINQAQALQNLGLYRRARTRLETINQQLQTQPDSELKVIGLQSLGVALQVVGDLKQSEKILNQSLSISSKKNQSAILFSLGNTARGLQKIEVAKQLYEQAAQTANTAIGKLEAQLNLFSLLIETKLEVESENLLPKIIAGLEEISPSRAGIYGRVNLAESLIKLQTYHQNLTNSNFAPQIAKILATGIEQAKTLHDQRAEAYAIGELGHLYEQNQQWLDAEKLTEKALGIAQEINAYDITARWQWQLGRIFKQTGNIPAAIAAYTEAVKNLQSLRSDLVAINPDVQFSFRESVEPVYRQLVELLLQSNPSQANLKQARAVIERLQLAELDNFFREACLAAKPEQIDKFDPHGAIIYPIILPDRLEVIASLYGQPLKNYQTRLTQTEIETTLEQLLESLNPAYSNSKRLMLSQQVYDWLIRPIAADLETSKIKTLVFVLDGALRNLPMSALHDGKQYLIEKYSVALSQGLQLPKSRSLVKGEIKALTAGLTEARQGFAALPGVKKEINQIAAEVPSQIFLDRDFTASKLQNLLKTTNFPIIHLATHGQFSSHAENTFLLTWDGQVNVKDFDELIRARGQTASNPLELLVLSACQTATGDKRAALGLAGVAVRSGARSTMATLWSVKDESTAKLMTHFYQQINFPGVSKAEALRQAQLNLLQQNKYQHPFYWAPFILVGNWL